MRKVVTKLPFLHDPSVDLPSLYEAVLARPDDPDARETLGHALARTRRYSYALAHLLHARALEQHRSASAVPVPQPADSGSPADTPERVVNAAAVEAQPCCATQERLGSATGAPARKRVASRAVRRRPSAEEAQAPGRVAASLR